MGEKVTTLLVSLEQARQLRLQAEGVESSVIAQSREALFAKLLPPGQRYDWNAISETLNNELKHAYADAATAETLHLLVRADLIGADGEHAIRLAGLNQVETGLFSVAGGSQVLSFSAAAEPAKAQSLQKEAQGTKEAGLKVLADARAATLDNGSSDPKLREAVELPLGILKVAASLVTGLPPGQRVPALVDGPFETSFDLGTVTQKRKENDVVRVRYALVRKKDKDWEETDVAWEDNFILRSFGWQQTLSSGFALLQQEDTNDWKPTPVLNWTIDWRRWPKIASEKKSNGAESNETASSKQDPGRRKLVTQNWFSGGGLSLLTPDFEDEQDVEVALGAQLSFVNHRITVGYGVNLSAD